MGRYPPSVTSRVSIRQALNEQAPYLPKRSLLIPLLGSLVFALLTVICLVLAYTTAYNGLFALLTVLFVLGGGVSWLLLDVVRRAW